MQSTFGGALDAGRRVQVFLDAQAATLGKVVPPTIRAMLDDAVTQLAGFQIEQATAVGTAKGETVNQTTLRDDLYQRFMVQVGRTAKVELRNTPEFPNLVVSALARRKLDFVSTATKFADAAAKHEQLLIDHGMPADFLVQLRAAIAAVSASADSRGRNVARRIAATQGCIAMNKALRQKIGQIDGLIKPALKKNAALLADWRASKQIRQLPVTPLPTGGTVVTPAPTPAAQPTTPPVVPPAAAA
jgi:hypothetical protein